MRILHLEEWKYRRADLKKLEEIAIVDYLEEQTQLSLNTRLAKIRYQAIFTRLGLVLDEAVLQNQKELKYIVTPTTGLNHIDTEFCSSHNIEVISLYGETEFLSGITSTAEHTWSLILALTRNITRATTDVKSGYWRREPHAAYELAGKTLGVIGYGRLGKIVTGYGKCFRMDTIAYDIDDSVFDQNVKQVTLNQLLRSSDIVSLHIPSNTETAGFMSMKKLCKMKPGSFFINTSRGEIVDEQALLSVLIEKKIAGAALDVLSGDSSWENRSPKDHLLVEYAINHDKLLITPHVGGYGYDSIAKTRRFITTKFLNTYRLIENQ